VVEGSEVVVVLRWSGILGALETRVQCAKLLPLCEPKS
jgi:hypothetical protein